VGALPANSFLIDGEAIVTGDAEMGILRRMLAHYRMLRFLRNGRWQSAKMTIRTFWQMYLSGR
jgi:hypothetical protein